MAERSVAAAARQESQGKPENGSISGREAGRARSEIRPLVRAKVIAEAAMLLRCAAFLGDTDAEMARAIHDLARRLVPAARGESLLVALCREPTLALDHAAAHIHLTGLGHPDASVDQMLAEIAQGEAFGGPERLPNHELEHHWLRQIWAGSGDPPDADLVARTCIARPLDALGSATEDLYAFTHVVLHASDMGRRSPPWPRWRDEIAADAEAALAAALDADNLDLAAELLWTWPMLGLAWSPAAMFSFGLLASAQDEHGFLPGPQWSAGDAAQLPDDRRDEYKLRTSYHATLVMGFLCASALRHDPPPRAVSAMSARGGALDAVLALVDARPREARWRGALLELDAAPRESLADLVLSIALRRARNAHDLEGLRECLSVWSRFDLVAGPSVHQALGLLRRATLLGQATSVAQGSVV